MAEKNPIKQMAGRKGGIKTKKLYGLSHFSFLGKRGMKSRWNKKLSTLHNNEQDIK